MSQKKISQPIKPVLTNSDDARFNVSYPFYNRFPDGEEWIQRKINAEYLVLSKGTVSNRNQQQVGNDLEGLPPCLLLGQSGLALLRRWGGTRPTSAVRDTGTAGSGVPPAGLHQPAGPDTRGRTRRGSDCTFGR
uniref:Uncharacterized protein n=1 Tax=Homalodisca liturata TaxID=320908 RepID=A0A1B6IJ39_9HEMI